jgi:hypothetical protein
MTIVGVGCSLGGLVWKEFEGAGVPGFVIPNLAGFREGWGEVRNPPIDTFADKQEWIVDEWIPMGEAAVAHDETYEAGAHE